MKKIRYQDISPLSIIHKTSLKNSENSIISIHTSKKKSISLSVHFYIARMYSQEGIYIMFKHIKKENINVLLTKTNYDDKKIYFINVHVDVLFNGIWTKQD